jgi:hypothetical protein
MADNVIPTNLALTAAQIKMLDDVAREHLGVSNRSAAARYIFNDWPKLKNAAIRAAAPLADLDLAVTGAYDEPLTVHAN